MNKLANLNLKKVCRLCFVQCDDTYSIFSEVQTESINFNIQDLLLKIVDIELSNPQELPNKICERCLHLLIEISKFMQVCLDSNKEIQNYYTDLKVLKTLEKRKPKKKVVFQGINDNCNENLGDEKDQDDQQKSSIRLKYYLQTVESGDKMHVCNLCPTRFMQPRDLRKHLITHGDKPYVCNECKAELPTYRHLIWHLKKKHSTDNENKAQEIKNKKIGSYYLEDGQQFYACNLCEERYTSFSQLKNHLSSHGDKPYWCKYCKKCFGTLTLLMSHIKRHSTRARYKCDLCDKSYTENSALKLHKRRHRGEKPYLCTICGKFYVSPSDLKTHLRSHSDAKEHMCPYCGLIYKSSGGLVIHLRTHTGEKPYKCSVCPEAFSKTESLRLHKISHTGLKPYNCTICEKGFNSRSNLKAHFRTHSILRSYVCEICYKGFNYAQSLRNHLLIHERQQACNTVD